MVLLKLEIDNNVEVYLDFLHTFHLSAVSKVERKLFSMDQVLKILKMLLDEKFPHRLLNRKVGELHNPA